MEAGVKVSFEDVVFFSNGFREWKLPLSALDFVQITFLFGVPPGFEDLNVVKGCPGLVDLKGEITPLLVDYGVLSISEVLVVKVLWPDHQ